MAEQGFCYEGLTPVALLELVAGTGAAALDLARAGLAVLGEADPVLGVRAGLLLPDRAAGSPPVEQLRRQLEQQCQARPHSGDGSMALAEGLVWCLLSSAGQDQGTVEAAAGEWLVITAGDEAMPEVAALSERLRFHCTSLRAACVDDGRRNRRRYLFHLCADRQRVSSFAGLVAAGGLQRASLLAAFTLGATTLFLPRESRLDRLALELFQRITTAAPELLGLPRLAAAPQGPLLALVPDRAVPQRLELLPLAGIELVDRPQLTPSAAAYLELEITGMLTGDRQGLAPLRAAIAACAGSQGHRLELQPTGRGDGSARTIRRLREQLDEVRHRLAYETSISGAQPVLLRFPANRPEHLVAAIRRFPLATLAAGTVEYGFQVCRTGPAGSGPVSGWHFLLYHLETVAMEVPYPQWEHGGITHFWVDPFWAEHTLQRRGEPGCLVFVPRQTTLRPTPHAWRPEQADSDLRATVSEWFPAHQAAINALKQPIYVFSPAPDDRLCLHLLDRSELRPLQESIGWINDQLLLQQRLGGVEQLLASLADDLTAADLAAGVRATCADQVNELEAAAAAANQSMAASAASLLDLLTAEIVETTRRCDRAATTISELHQALTAVEQAAGSSRAQLVAAEEMAKASAGAAGTLLNDLQLLETRLDQAASRRSHLAERCQAEVARLQALEKRLRQDLRRALGGRGSRS